MGLRRLGLVAVLLGFSSLATAQIVVPPATTGQVSLTSGTCTTEGQTSSGCVALSILNYAGLSIQVTGTWTGTLTFRASTDGVTFQALNCAASNSTSAVTSSSANGLWKCGVAGLRYAEVIFTSYSSGTAVVTMQASTAADGSGTSAAGSGSNAAAGATGSAVPASASYTGINSGGTLVGLPGDTTNGAFVNCKAGCAAAGDTTAAAANITSGSGNGSTFPNGPAPSGLALAGDNGAAFQLAAGGTLVATITPQCSTDGGTTYFNAYFQDFFSGALTTTQTIASGQAVTAWQVLCPAGSSHAQLKATAFTSGSASFTGRSTVARWPTFDLGAVSTSAPTYVNGQIAPLSLTTAGAARVDPSGVTSPISAVSLPLPSGASTSAKQPAFGTAGSASADVVSVQGIASMTPFAVSGTFFQSTQPVSIADGSDTTLGAKADAKSTATDTTAVTMMQVFKEISFMEQNPVSRAVTNAGTFATQSAITAASGSIASGAVASGAVASGAFASGAISDGADVTLGAKGDAKSTATDTTAVTIMQVLKEISAMEQAPASRAVTNAGTFADQATLQTQTDTVMVGGVNIKEINGVAPLMGAGATGTGALRVNDVASSATAAAPPASGQFIVGLGSGATGGLLTGITVCDKDFNIDINTATTTLAITGVAGRQVRICHFNMVATATDTVAWIEGTGATCGTGTAGMIGSSTAAHGQAFAANGGIATGTGIGEILTTATAGDSVCIVTSAATQLDGHIKYAIY